MTRFYLTLLISAIIALSCKQNEDLNYYYVSYRDREYERADTNTIYRTENILTKDSTRVTYFCQNDTLTYLFDNHKRDSSKIRSSYDFDGSIRVVLDTTVILGNDTFDVTEYISNELVTDGSSIHYFTPKFGVFTTHSGTWPGIRFLQTSDTVTNSKIIRLLKATVPDFFVRGKLANDL